MYNSTADLYYDATTQTLGSVSLPQSLYFTMQLGCIFIHTRVYEISRVHGFCTSCFSFEVWLHHSTRYNVPTYTCTLPGKINTFQDQQSHPAEVQRATLVCPSLVGGQRRRGQSVSASRLKTASSLHPWLEGSVRETASSASDQESHSNKQYGNSGFNSVGTFLSL